MPRRKPGPKPAKRASKGAKSAPDTASPQMQQSASMLDAALKATADGMLIVDREGRIVRFNRQFARMWNLSAAVLDSGDDDAALAEAVSKIRDPDAFLSRVRYLYDHPDEKSEDSIALTDGRVFERFSRPQILDGGIVGRVWSFRDVTDRVRAERGLRQSEDRYRRLFESSPLAIYVTNLDGKVVEANPAMFQLFGFAPEEMGEFNVQSLYINPEDRTRLTRLIAEHGSIMGYPVRLRSRDGQPMECLLTSTAARDARGTIIGYQGMVRDVTAAVAAEHALRESELKFRTLIANATDTITVLDQNGQITYESPSLLHVLGYQPEALIGRNVFEFVHPDDQQSTLQEFQRLLLVAGHTARMEVRFLHGDATWRTLEVTARNLLDDDAIRGVVINSRDISEHKRSEARLLHDAFHDKLTQLPNRALLMDRMAQMLRRAQRGDAPVFAVLFLDLDRFKVVNDSLGHMTGDQLLIGTARRLESLLRPGDTVARLGGDEFTMLLDGTDVDEARAVANRVQQNFLTPFALDTQELFVTVSIGIATSQMPYRTPEEMLRDADVAMYRAKDRGRARFEVFDSSMRAEAVQQLELETDMRRAVEREEFELFYQPIVTLGEGSLHGFEALLRWNHPQRGLLVPAAFGKLADDTGLIVPMGTWVLRAACRQLREWLDQHGAATRPLHVNISAHQVAHPDFVSRVQDALDEFDIPPHLIQLELTESTMMQNAERATHTLRELKQLGVGLSIDDFGTGFSSLSYLHRFPTDSVKIDRSFISQMGPRARHASIVRTIIDLAHDLRMVVIAEGIETEAQASALRGARCEYGQGFHFSRPVPAADATQLLASGHLW